MVPVCVKKQDGDWQKLDILLDTGSAKGCMLAKTTVNQHGIAIRHDYNSPASIGPLPCPGNSMPMSPIWVELQLEGNARVVEAKILKTDDFSGVIGSSLLLNRRIIIDVVKNRAVKIGCIPERTRLARIRSLVFKRERQRPSLEYHGKLPWANLNVRDSKGEWQPLTAIVDTGNSEMLSLPLSCVETFGLRLLDKCQMNTVHGQVDASCGEVEILWRGYCRPVICIQHQEERPPLIGMKLLQGNRITIDVDRPAPVVNIAPIPRTVSSIESILESSKDRLRHILAGRSRPRG